MTTHICRPGHGAKRESLSLSVVRIGQRRWRVSVPGGHRGLLLRAEGAGGLWWGHVPGYKEKGRWVTLTRGFINTDLSRCVTHSDPEEKGATSFVWRAHRDETPSFSGVELFT